MADRRRTYEVISEAQRKILCDFFDKGMNSTASNMQRTIVEASDKANVTVERVKKWIGNERQKRKASSAIGTDLPGETSGLATRKCPVKRGTTAYNLFCSSMLTSDECKQLTNSEKLKLTVSTWNSLTSEERSKWIEKAKELQKVVVSELSEKECNQRIKKARKQLISQLAYMETLGCEASVLLMDPSDSCKLKQYGTEKGMRFLEDNQTIALKFGEYVDTSHRVNFKVDDVAKLFNKKYSEACGKASSRVPYKKGGFEVTGLPDALSFKRPSAYGQKQINAIMENAENITFILSSLPDKRSEITTVERMQLYTSILSKIINEDKVADCLSQNHKIQEEDLEVYDFDLNEEEFNIITTELSHCFGNDAMTACKKNYEVTRAHCGYVLPVYNTTKAEPYWLFYHPGKAEEIENLQADDKIFGYWLDKDKTEQELCYKLLVEQDKTFIVALNMISKDQENLGTLRLRKALELNYGAKITCHLILTLQSENA
ncbi:uncharacterized protein LOC114540361 [Dendronephthya gigantea]|uniref:uncharacterized protein LOC114540361 n=1 Tax=Dendronephthya gigantea TaxID=151771 RepID=UPI001069890E|nr:uncharacterized protein LOC114540361 [Dendronephthya gigantea]